MNSLPDQFSYEELEILHVRMQKKIRPIMIWGWITTFTITQLKKDLKSGKGIKKITTFSKSREYNDLQLVLDQFAKSKVNVLFVFHLSIKNG